MNMMMAMVMNTIAQSSQSTELAMPAEKHQQGSPSRSVYRPIDQPLETASAAWLKDQVLARPLLTGSDL